MISRYSLSFPEHSNYNHPPKKNPLDDSNPADTLFPSLEGAGENKSLRQLAMPFEWLNEKNKVYAK